MPAKNGEKVTGEDAFKEGDKTNGNDGTNGDDKAPIANTASFHPDTINHADDPAVLFLMKQMQHNSDFSSDDPDAELINATSVLDEKENDTENVIVDSRSNSFDIIDAGFTSTTYEAPTKSTADGIVQNIDRTETMGVDLDEEAKNLENYPQDRSEVRVQRKSFSSRYDNTIRSSVIIGDSFGELQELRKRSSHALYPPDCYSFIALNGPAKGKWPKRKIIFFLFGLMVFFFQMIILILMILGRMYKNQSDIESDNPIDAFVQFIPANSKVVIRVSQVVCMLTYTIFPDSTLMDVFKAYQYFPRPSKESHGPVKNMRFSCIVRGFQGYLATITVFLVVITTQSVVDIILNFTALNFISSLDDEAFALAKSGVFGVPIRKEAERIEKTKLPACMVPQSTIRLYWSVMGSTAAMLFFLLFCVIGFQNSPHWWITPSLRVEFRSETGLSEYSGCYGIDGSSRFLSRFAYKEDDKDVSFGYCTESRRWILFDAEEDNPDPCHAYGGKRERAHSTETAVFDIAKSFEELWYYPHTTTQIDMFFFADYEIENLYCDKILGDGICDPELNDLGYEFDSGDCCAPTCTGPNCGQGYTSAFGNSNVSGMGFPNCADPNVVPITIRLNDIVSSRDPQFTSDQSYACFLNLAKKGDAEWRAVPPMNPILVLNCDGVYVLSVRLDASMKNSTETVWIKNGADCTMRVENTTSIALPGIEWIDGFSFYCEDPIWFVDYTIFHEENSGAEINRVEILSQHSSENEFAFFKRIPKCYIEELTDYVDTASMYTASNPLGEAIGFLLDDGVACGVACGDKMFTERFAISTIMMSMFGKRAILNNDLHHCAWSWTRCSSSVGPVTELHLYQESLEGPIPSEMKVLTDLENLFMCKSIVCIQTMLYVFNSCMRFDKTTGVYSASQRKDSPNHRASTLL
jgi:hypothetical protein